jgi:hypothetical protein
MEFVWNWPEVGSQYRRVRLYSTRRATSSVILGSHSPNTSTIENPSRLQLNSTIPLSRSFLCPDKHLNANGKKHVIK